MCNGHSPRQQAQSLGHQRSSASTSAASAISSRLRPIDYAMWVAVTAGFITIILDVLVWKP